MEALYAIGAGLASFSACWAIHWIVWRIRRPDGYLIWLPILFVVLPACVSIVALWLTRMPAETFCLAVILHVTLAACYTLQYAGVIEYSPSAEVLKFVRKSMPSGVLEAEIDAPTLSEYALTLKRIDHLLESGCAAQDDEGRIALTQAGIAAIETSRRYRRFLNLPGFGGG